MRRSVTAAGIGAAAMVVAWRKAFTPWQRNWGATEEEVTAALPGDELTPPPVEQCTRAITIAAPPEEVWPWLVQMGADGGGFYSYAWMENLFGLQIHNADVSRADAPAETMTSRRIEEPGNVPIDVELTYDPAIIDERFTYAVRATIEVDGKMWWTSTQAHHVLTHGAPDHVEVMVSRVSG